MGRTDLPPPLPLLWLATRQTSLKRDRPKRRERRRERQLDQGSRGPSPLHDSLERKIEQGVEEGRMDEEEDRPSPEKRVGLSESNLYLLGMARSGNGVEERPPSPPFLTSFFRGGPLFPTLLHSIDVILHTGVRLTNLWDKKKTKNKTIFFNMLFCRFFPWKSAFFWDVNFRFSLLSVCKSIMCVYVHYRHYLHGPLLSPGGRPPPALERLVGVVRL